MNRRLTEKRFFQSYVFSIIFHWRFLIIVVLEIGSSHVIRSYSYSFVVYIVSRVLFIIHHSDSFVVYIILFHIRSFEAWLSCSWVDSCTGSVSTSYLDRVLASKLYFISLSCYRDVCFTWERTVQKLCCMLLTLKSVSWRVIETYTIDILIYQH